MDCEKFDQHVLDALYEELDELTSAALRRHVEGCSRCSGVWTRLRATREVGVLPLVEPPDDLEARILDAVAVAQTTTPLHKRVLRGLAWAGSHAMRPQLAMAAIFFLVIGSSLALLRNPKRAQSPVSVTERGVPAAEPAEVAAPPAAAPTMGEAQSALQQAPAASAPADQARSRAVAGDLRAEGGDDARAALASARAARDASGCKTAVAQLDAVAVRFAGTQAAADAMWDEASCYKQMGDGQHAQQLYLALRSTGYRDRADQELAASERGNPYGQSNVAPGAASTAMAAAPMPAAVAAAPAPPPPAKAADQGGAAAPPAAKAAKAAAKPAAGAPNPKAPAAPRAMDNSAFVQ